MCGSQSRNVRLFLPAVAIEAWCRVGVAGRGGEGGSVSHLEQVMSTWRGPFSEGLPPSRVCTQVCSSVQLPGGIGIYAGAAAVGGGPVSPDRRA